MKITRKAEKSIMLTREKVDRAKALIRKNNKKKLVTQTNIERSKLNL